ncbi:hypothetical protein AK88_02669 [Plasmodium fragile]|uniref:W2 domain-containing protein n=1 Tax=Plasmodium fragile TaxID=5857 RepID=A0A0D9QPN8_PLAFR|nr:uncharacterized protein AK88_02669 [Plasmodium fragile]KJP87641.1 hypothetical protein AK88_02669 [Plasmodium fragile]
MAKKKKQIHVNIIDLQKYYQKDDLIIDAKLPEPNKADERRKKIFEQNEFVQNIEWRVLDADNQNNKGNENFNRRDDNRNKNAPFDKDHGRKGEFSPHLGHRSKSRQNGTGSDEDEDVDFANLRSRRHDDADFANVRSKRDDDVDFSNLRNKRDEDDIDFANLRNKRDDDVDFSNLRSKRDDDVDFTNIRNKRDDDVDFTNIRNKRDDDKEADERAKKEADERAKKEADERAKKEAEVKAKKEAEEKAKKEAEEKAKKEAEERAKKEAQEKAKKEAQEKAKKEAEEKAKKEAEEKAANDAQDKDAEETALNGAKQPTPVDVAKPADQAGEETPKKKFVPKRVIMYQLEQKEKEERNQKLLEEQKKQREMKLQLLKSKSQGLSTFIPTAKLLHMEAQKEIKQNEAKKEVFGGTEDGSNKAIAFGNAAAPGKAATPSKADALISEGTPHKMDTVVGAGGSISPKMRPTNEQRKSATLIKRGSQVEQKNVKSIIEEIAEKTENAKIIEKMDIEEVTKKRREELYKKQLEKITKRNEENEKYNNIYKHDLASIKTFYLKVKNRIEDDQSISQDECVDLCSLLQTHECNYLESHVPLIVTITVFILSLTQKCADEVYMKKAANLRLLFLYLKESSKIENHEEYILNDVVKICDELKYPHLSEETSLVEAAFDALLFTGVISKGSFVKWFDEDNSDSELKSKAMLQLIYWHKWLTEEEPQDVDDEEEEAEVDMEEEEKAEAENEDVMKENLPKSYLFKKIKKKIF